MKRAMLASAGVVVAALACAALFGRPIMGPYLAAWLVFLSLPVGALPLVLFGPVGYGRVVGRIARPALMVQALAPFLVASAIERFSDQAVLQSGVVAALLVLACFAAIAAPAPSAVHRK